ncbi:hypothetical protein CANCADRAFT_3490 [Tortispora caseinolytica NRRL Y-17796]|uniref:NDT80 domain-containing protein n=1 Tax=Tortispora caseinolytica NRRL Y-17796 TaxID=767744 RepID=A0A1E4TAP5_9ASCO|nr:hypothetical protein CANCADRAFT_3490 [Tortispora caseinolytica NRRL Y-17796]
MDATASADDDFSAFLLPMLANGDTHSLQHEQDLRDDDIHLSPGLPLSWANYRRPTTGPAMISELPSMLLTDATGPSVPVAADSVAADDTSTYLSTSLFGRRDSYFHYGDLIPPEATSGTPFSLRYTLDSQEPIDAHTSIYPDAKHIPSSFFQRDSNGQDLGPDPLDSDTNDSPVNMYSGGHMGPKSISPHRANNVAFLNHHNASITQASAQSDSDNHIFSRHANSAPSSNDSPDTKSHPPYDDHSASHLFLHLLPAQYHATLFDAHKRKVTVDVEMNMLGKFLLVPEACVEIPKDQIHPDNPDVPIVFHRRNGIQITGTLSNLNKIATLKTSNMKTDLPVKRLFLEVVGCSTNTNETPQLTTSNPHSSTTRKLSDNANDDDEVPKGSYGPHPSAIPLSKDSDLTTFAWKRILFRSATANNGKKRMMQEYYFLEVLLNAELQDGRIETVLSAKSRPLIIRGRNPRSYIVKVALPINLPRSREPRHLPSDTSNDLKDPPSIHSNSIDRANFTPNDDEQMRKRSNDELSVASDQKKRKVDDSSLASGSPRPLIQGNYEYIPITVNYYMPPVEVVYRPHAAHHPQLRRVSMQYGAPYVGAPTNIKKSALGRAGAVSVRY